MANKNYLEKELYELIKADERIFDFIQNGSLDGMWYWDLEHPENEWMNNRFWEVLGYDPEEMPHRADAWQDIIHEEDLKCATENFLSHCKDPDHPYDQIVRYTHKNGSTVWIRCRGLAIRDDSGKPIRMLGAHQDVSDLKKREADLITAYEKLAESKTKIESILEATIDGVWVVDMDANVLEVNKQAGTMLGYSREEMVQLSVKDIDHIQTDTHIQRYNHKVLERGEERFETKHRRKNSEVIDVEVSIKKQRSKDLFTVFIRDITDRKKIEQELLLQSKIAENMDEGVYLIRSTDGVILYTNPVFEKMFGYESNELIGQHVNIVNAPTHKKPEETSREIISSLNEHGSWSGEVLNIRKDGTIFWCNAKVSSFDHSEYGPVWVSVHEDITERKRIEKELKQSLNDKNVLLSEVHHRVKNNLAVVSGMMQLQSFDEKSSEVRERLMDSISRIQTIAKIHEKLYQHEIFSSIDLSENIGELVHEVIHSFNPGKNIEADLTLNEVRLNINQAVPCSLIVNEVVVNALKHAFIGRENGLVFVSLEEKAGQVCIKIADNGVGLPVAVQQKSQSKGTMIIKALTEQLEGEYTYKSGHPGTEFTLKFAKDDVVGLELTNPAEEINDLTA